MSKPSIKLRYIRPLIPEPREWLPYLEPAYELKHYTNFGPVNARFEDALGRTFAAPRKAVTTTNATVGLVAALQSLCVRGRVVIPSFTFPATAQAVLMAGCTPVFCDCNAISLGLEPEALKAILASETISAVIHVRAFGFNYPLAEVERLTRAHGIPLIVDAASALGLEAGEKTRVGAAGTMEVFSLHATKVFGIGEGGVVFVDPDFEDTFRRTTNFSLDGPEVLDVGTNGKLSEFHAAIGLKVLEMLPEFVRHRRQVARRYHEILCGLPGVQRCWPAEIAPWQCYPVLCSTDVDVSEVIARAADGGVELRRYYYLPLHRTRAFSAFGTTDLPITDVLANGMLCLPVYSDMSDREQEQVLDVVEPLLR